MRRGYAGEAREAARPHDAADDAQPRLLTVMNFTKMMRLSAQTTPAGLGSPKMLRPMRPRTDAAFSWLHGFVRSMTGRVGHPQGWPAPEPGTSHLTRFRRPIGKWGAD